MDGRLLCAAWTERNWRTCPMKDEAMTKYECPVCFYPDLDEPPTDHEICPCCGTHFDYSDAGPLGPSAYWPHLRNAWIKEGMKWWFQNEKYGGSPEGWMACSGCGRGSHQN